MSIKVLQLHKRAAYEFKFIQDRYSYNLEKKTFALADGTTQSFNSELWAQIITKTFCLNPIFNSKELIEAFKRQVQDYKNAKYKLSSNPAKASLERAKQIKGGTATFIGLQFKELNKIELISCGDTNCFLVNEKNETNPFPYTDIDSLDANNYFINTEILLADEVDDSFFKHQTVEFSKKDTLIIATDALSRLFLTKPSTVFEILKINSFQDFLNFCLKYWENKELQEDDISVIIIPVNDMEEVKVIEPPVNFSFPKEEEVEFVLPSLNTLNQGKHSNMDINEIRKQFSGVANDFHSVKRKQHIHKYLLFLILVLLVVNILLTFLLKPTSFRVHSSDINNSEYFITHKYSEIIDGIHLMFNNIKNRISSNKVSVTGKKNESEIIETPQIDTPKMKNDENSTEDGNIERDAITPKDMEVKTDTSITD